MKNLRILLDLDEVLVDFVGSACRVHGVDRDEVNAYRVEWRCWDLVKAISSLPGREISMSQFWEPIHKLGEQFWLELKELPWAREMFDLVTQIIDVDCFIVTSPSLETSSYSAKVKYMRRMFGPTFDNFVVTSHKYLMAREGVLLIDDRPENVEKFIRYGGDGILFPSHGNKFHEFATNPVPYVKSMLEEKFNAH